MSGYRGIVTEHRTRGLVDSYLGPPQTEEPARSLIAPLVGGTTGLRGHTPWRLLVAGGQSLFELQRQR